MHASGSLEGRSAQNVLNMISLLVSRPPSPTEMQAAAGFVLQHVELV
jgi:hypothetical protein